ncbi:Guanylate cyclase [Aphelenchoides fujianensis]|nr:Guanylate cyclase [Aphelenchoides fujianensis]
MNEQSTVFPAFSPASNKRQKRQAEGAGSDESGNSSSTFANRGPDMEVRADASGKFTIRLGHIGAVGALPNDDKILNISRMQLIEDGVLGKDLDFDIVNKMGCGDSFEGVAVAASMYHVEKVRAFIGPYCNTELEAVAKMASFWNIPVISYMPTTTALNDRTIYKTLARISSKNTNSIAHSVVRLVQHYGWSRVAIVTNTGTVAYERVLAFEEEFRQNGVAVIKKVLFEEDSKADDMIKSGLLAELASSARIIICLFSNTRELTREFMQATFKTDMNNAEYAYILPWLQSGTKDSSPWIGTSGEMLQQVKDSYQNAIIVDDVNGFENTIVTGFMKQVEKYGLKAEDIDASNIFGYLHLYDSLRLYALAAREVLEKNGKNATFITNGRMIWNAMRRLSFEGGTGRVVLDDVADRAPLFAAFYIAPNRDKILKMVSMEFHPLPNCDGIANRSGCYDIKVVDVIQNFWPSANGSMPADEPFCGFRNQRCNYTLEIVCGSTLVALLVVFLITYCIYRHCQNVALAKMPWRINHDDLRMINEEQARSLLSLGSANTRMSNMSTGNKMHAILGINTHAVFHKYPQRRPIKFAREDLQLLTQVRTLSSLSSSFNTFQMKQAIHDNLNPFLGMSFNEKDVMLVVWKFCSRGTVQDIIYNKTMVLDEKFHAAFVRDITLGLEYLHLSPIGYHGSLTTWACLIDRNWSVRLTDYGIANPLERWEKHGAISITAVQSDDDKSQAAQRTSALYQAPEQLKNREANRQRTSDQRWVAQSASRRQSADIYAFGMVMYEILFRALPFPEGTDINGVIEATSNGSRHVKPQIQDEMKIHPDLAALLIDCWSTNAEIRPSIRRVRLNTDMILKIKGSLVEQMMRVMENYANNLEKLVQERTGMLEEANLKAERLLHQLLPAYVANELKAGRPVPPKLFASATVMFSDIVGFTTICSASTPLEVVTMLNAFYTGFDEIISKNGAYKVETIGDAYLVVSGIPEENGTRHVMHIADIVLAMRKFTGQFKVPHRPNQRIQCRWGFHSGAVAAGVVGLTAPRYCLFGDTVNTASRMESTGEAAKIQLSQQSYDLLHSTYPVFDCELRGEVEIKGKGLCKCYWLLRRTDDAPSED